MTHLKSKSFTAGLTKGQNSQRLGGLMSMTDRVGLSMSLPLLLIRLSSYSGVKTLLPLLVLSECSVGLKLTGDRKLFPWVLLALGKVFRPSAIHTEHKRYSTKRYCNSMYACKYFLNCTSCFNLPQQRIGHNIIIMKFTDLTLHLEENEHSSQMYISTRQNQKLVFKRWKLGPYFGTVLKYNQHAWKRGDL